MRTAEGDQRQSCSCRQYRPDPPDLPRRKVGGRHGRQFGRQAEAGRKRENGKAGKAPEQALPPACDAAERLGHSDQNQREADRSDDIGAGSIGKALEAVGRRPGFVVMLMRVQPRAASLPKWRSNPAGAAS